MNIVIDLYNVQNIKNIAFILAILGTPKIVAEGESELYCFLSVLLGIILNSLVFHLNRSL